MRDLRRFMALGVNEGNRTRPFNSGGAGCQALHGFAGDLRQSNSPVRLLWCRMPGASWPWVRSKAIDLVCSTRVARNPRRFMALGAIEGNRTHPFDLGGVGSQALNGLGCDRRQSIELDLLSSSSRLKNLPIGVVEELAWHRLRNLSRNDFKLCT